MLQGFNKQIPRITSPPRSTKSGKGNSRNLFRSLSSIFKAKQEKIEIDIWKEIARIPFYKISSEDGFAHLFFLLRRFLNFPCYYLYSFNAGTKKLILESMDIRQLDMPEEVMEDTGIGEEIAFELTEIIEGKSDILRKPDLSINFQSDHKMLWESKEFGIDFLNIPLLLGGQDFVGIVLAGPVKNSEIYAANIDLLKQFSMAAAPAVQSIKKYSILNSEIESLNARIEVSRKMLGSALEADSFVKLLLDLALTATRAEAGFVAITDDSSQSMEIRAHKNLPQKFLEKINLSTQDGLFDWSADEHEVLILQDFDFVAEFNIKSILAVPLVENQNLLGVFALVSFAGKEMFSDFSLTILNNFVEQIRLVFKNSKLFEEFTSRYFKTLISMSNAYEFRSPYTTGHSQRVADICVAIGRQLNFEKKQIKNLADAALIHDVGMCGVVEVGDGYQADYNHPYLSTSMIEIMPLSKDIIQAVISHHEWFDGWGFPQGLKGEQIPLNGRILAISEYYVEITSNNKLKKAISWLKLIEELNIRRETQFDPGVVDALISVLTEKQQSAGIRALDNCWQFKGQPDDICAKCPAFKSQKRPCWSFQEVLCRKHGDELCDYCFIFNEWLYRIEKILKEKQDGVKLYNFNLSTNEDSVALQLEGEVDIAAVIELKEILYSIIGKGAKDILVDLRNVKRIDQYGLGIIVVAEKYFKAKGGKIRFLNVRQRN